MDKVDQTNQKGLILYYLLYFIYFYKFFLLIFINNIKINFIHKYFIYFVKRCDNQ